MYTIRVLLILLLLTAVSSNFSLFINIPQKQQAGNKPGEYIHSDAKTFKILKIMDGDSLLVTDGRQNKMLRLIGIDAPETSTNIKAVSDAKKHRTNLKNIKKLGKKSKVHLQELLNGRRNIRIRTESGHRDRHGRLLVYAFLEDGTFLNLKMIEDGFARAYPVLPDIRYSDLFSKAHSTARQKKKGLWAESVIIF